MTETGPLDGIDLGDDPDGVGWHDTVSSGGLVQPETARWSVLRGGAVNLWEFDYAEYAFAGGRVQFVGANQSGKSTLMALTSLILLAGNLERGLVDTFGDQHKSFRYYVEASGEDKDRREVDSSASRGWAWLEFGRVTADGPQFFTLLLFAEAKRGSTQLTRTWAVAEGVARVRDGIALQVGLAVNSPDQLGSAVTVLKNGQAYQKEVAERLWGYRSSDRLDAVVRILKVLRTPHLGQRLDPDFFSEQMREALPGIERGEIDQLAAGWDQLERLAADRDDAEEALRAVRSYSRRFWTPWADSVIRLYADALVSANTQFDNVTREERTARETQQRAAATVRRLDAEVGEAKAASETAQKRYELHLKSPAYQEATAALASAEQAKTLADQATVRLTLAESTQTDAGTTTQSRRTKHGAAAAQVEADRRKASDLGRELLTLAQPARFSGPLAEWVTDRDVDRLDAALRRREGEATFVRRLMARHRAAVGLHDRHLECLAKVEEQERQRRTELQAASAEVADALQRASDDLEGWSATVGDDAPDSGVRSEWVNRLVELARSESPKPVLIDLVRRGWLDPLVSPLGEQAALAEQEATELAAEAVRLEREADRIEAEIEPEPEPPQRWLRRHRPEPGGGGAPLWRLVDPRPGLAGAHLDLIEAALDAMGLLDAWVTPDGAWVANRDGTDLVLAPTRSVKPSAPGGLGEALTIDDEAGDLSPVLSSALAAIDLVPAGGPLGTAYALSVDGRWRTPISTGQVAGAPHGAELIGTAARAAHRARRVGELRQAAATAASKSRASAERAATLRRRAEGLRQAVSRLSDDGRLVRARLAEITATFEAEGAVRVVAEAAADAQASETEVARAWGELIAAATERDLPHLGEMLDQVDQSIQATARALAGWKPSLTVVERAEAALHSAEEALAEAVQALRQADTALAAAREEVRDAELAAEEAERKLADPERDQLVEEKRLNSERTACASALEGRREALEDARGKVVEADTTLRQSTEARERATETRDQALVSWGRPVRAGLAEDRGVDTSGSAGITTALSQAAAARRELQPKEWPTGDDPQARRRSAEAAYNKMVGSPLIELRAVLERSGGRTVTLLDATDADDLPTVEIRVDSIGTRGRPPEATRRLEAQVHELSTTYDQQLTRQLTELLSSTFIEHLRDRQAAVNRLIKEVNRVLAAHPTGAAQTVLRLSRMPSPDHADGYEVLRALEGPVIGESATQQQIRSFLERIIRQAQDEGRARNSDWKDRLAELLDYRRWFSVVTEYQVNSRLTEAMAGGIPRRSWRPLTKEVHGQDSGGGKAVTLLQPLVATLVALYSEAPGCPRPIWLDEAFTGVDDGNRAIMLDLLVDFDLDFVLAGPSVLVAVGQVPRAAIWFVTRAPALAPGVDLSLTLWTGQRRREVAVPEYLELVTTPSQAPPDSLFSIDVETGS